MRYYQSFSHNQIHRVLIDLVAGFNVVLSTSKHTVTNNVSVHRPSADERLLLTQKKRSSAKIDLCEFALSFSSRPFPGDAVTTSDSGNRDSEQPPAARVLLQKINVKQEFKKVLHYNILLNWKCFRLQFHSVLTLFKLSVEISLLTILFGTQHGTQLILKSLI